MKDRLKRVWLILSGKFKEYAVKAIAELNVEVGSQLAVETVTEHEHYRFKDVNVLALFLTRMQCLYTYRKVKRTSEGYELILFMSSDDYFTKVGKVLYVKFINKFRTQCNAILRDMFIAIEKEPVNLLYPEFYQIGSTHYLHKLTGPRDHYLIVSGNSSEVFNPHQSPAVYFLAALAKQKAEETDKATEEHTVEVDENQ